METLKAVIGGGRWRQKQAAAPDAVVTHIKLCSKAAPIQRAI
jgi:hypothetical protein